MPDRGDHDATIQLVTMRGMRTQAGYTREDHEEGLHLLAQVSDYGPTTAAVTADWQARTAQAQVHTWTTTHLPRLRAAVGRLHPERAGVLSWNAEAAPDAAGSLLIAAKLLQDLDGLEVGDPLLDTLARRRFDGSARAELAAAVSAAQNAPDAAMDGSDAGEGELIALHYWHRDWSTTARGVVHRRDWLAALGLVRRGRGAAGLGV